MTQTVVSPDTCKKWTEIPLWFTVVYSKRNLRYECLLRKSTVWTFLPTAYVVRDGRLYFHYVCQSTPRRGRVPWPGPYKGGGGEPWAGLTGGGGTPARSNGGGRYPSQVHMGYPRWGTPWQGWGTPPARTGWGIPDMGYTPNGVPPPPPPPVQDRKWSTWYAAVGMPLVFTQEDFLVHSKKIECCKSAVKIFWSTKLQRNLVI